MAGFTHTQTGKEKQERLESELAEFMDKTCRRKKQWLWS